MCAFLQADAEPTEDVTAVHRKRPLRLVLGVSSVVRDLTGRRHRRGFEESPNHNAYDHADDAYGPLSLNGPSVKSSSPAAIFHNVFSMILHLSKRPPQFRLPPRRPLSYKHPRSHVLAYAEVIMVISGQ